MGLPLVVLAFTSSILGCTGSADNQTAPPPSAGGAAAVAGMGGAPTAGTTGTTGGAAGAAGGATTVSYRSHIAPLFELCTACHFRGSIVPYQFQDPFDPVTGVVGVMGDWPEARNRMLVMPGHPEQSNLVDKLKGNVMHEIEGEPMPLSMPLPTAEEIEAVRVWIANGAQNDEQYRTSVAPLFGNHSTLGLLSGKCSFCHTAISPYPPNLVDPFDPMTGVINRQTIAGLLVVPGDPEASVLFRKVANMNLTRADGARMPYQFEMFTPAELELVETWIREGALNN